MNEYAVVVGGANMDIGGRSFGPLSARDSTPGRVRISPGGVGRNIAHNLALLGVKTYLLTALGDDPAAQALSDACAKAGIDMSCALRVPGGTTSTYLFIAGADGDMALAVNDMELCLRITPDYLAKYRELLCGATLVALDANIPADTVAFLADCCPAPLFADPVSVPKSEKLRPILGKLHTLKPNRLEAEALSGIQIAGENGLRRCGDALLETGLKQVFISLGSGGAYAATKKEQFLLPCNAGKPVNATGCGDAFMAAIAWSFFNHESLVNAARFGLAAASFAMECEETINPALCAQSLRARTER